MKLTQKQLNRINKASEVVDKGVTEVLKEVFILEDKLESDLSNLETKVSAEVTDIKDVVRELKIKEGPRGEKGDKGDKGESIVGTDGKDGKDGNNGKTPTKKELVAIITPLIPAPITGLSGLDGKDGVDGKDGSPDTGEQIIEKINNIPEDSDFKIDASRIKNLPTKSETIIRNIPSGSGTQPVKAGQNITITYDGNGAPVINATGGGGGDFVPYTGATAEVDLGTNALITNAVKVGNVALIDSSSGLAVVNRSNTSLQTAYFPPDGSLPITLTTDVILGTNTSTAAPTTLTVSGLITGDNVNTNTVTSTNSEVQGHLRLTTPGSVLEPSLRFNGEGVGAYSTGSYATQDGTIHFNTFDGTGSAGFDIMTLTSDGAGNNPKVTIGGSTAQLDIIGSSQSVVRIGDKVDGLAEFSNSDGTIISSGITSSSLMTQAKVLARSLGA